MMVQTSYYIVDLGLSQLKKDPGHILIVLSQAVKIGQTEKVGKANSEIVAC